MVSNSLYLSNQGKSKKIFWKKNYSCELNFELKYTQTPSVYLYETMAKTWDPNVHNNIHIQIFMYENFTFLVFIFTKSSVIFFNMESFFSLNKKKYFWYSRLNDHSLNFISSGYWKNSFGGIARIQNFRNINSLKPMSFVEYTLD